MSDIAHIVGQQVRQLRRAAGLSMEDCAEKAEMSVTFLGEVERGQKDPSLRTLRKLSGAIGVPIQEFIAGLERRQHAVPKKELLRQLTQVMADQYSEAEALAIVAFVKALRPRDSER